MIDTKVSFGLDFLSIMANVHMRSGKKGNMNGFLLARLFLTTEWGLTAEEGDEANQLFWQGVNKETLEDLGSVAERFIAHLKKDAMASSKFITQMMTINYLDAQITDEEKEFTMLFATELDFRKSEIDVMASKAVNCAISYDFFANNFVKDTS